MKDYLRGIIYEQINRGLSLKDIVNHPLEYTELESLADRCSRIIDSNIQYLRYLQKELEKRDEDDTRDILRSVKGCIREVDLVEYFGISALYVETDDVGYLNKLVRKIHKEINLPLIPPSVTCISTKHYSFHAFTNVIFVPVGETRFLLHLADVFHEIGHEILANMENELSLRCVNQKYDLVLRRVTDYYRDFLIRLERETGPKRTRRIMIQNIHYQWKTYWLKEFFCDLFAIYTLGPAYAWAHLHLTIKKYENIYEFSPILPMTHPSDDSRMRLMIIGLEKIGFKAEAKKILSKWNSMPFVAENEPVIEYHDAYPIELLDTLAQLLLNGIKESKFVSSKKMIENDSDGIKKLLNQCWEIFWKNPEEYIEWEAKSVRQLKSNFRK